MTDENLFKDSDCDIEAVPVVDFDFIPSDLVCETIPTPAPIFSCVAPVIIPEPPTDVGVECPVFSTTSKIEVGYKNNTGGDSACTVAANPSATLQITKTNVDPCDYEINLDINVPIPRPPCLTVLQGGSFNAQVGFAECVPPGASIQINRVDVPGDCETPDECQYTIDLDIGVPIPRIPCPELRLNTFTTTSGYENCINSAENRFDIVAVHREPNGCDDPGQCEFEIDLQIAVPIPEPPCPTLSVVNFSTQSAFAGTVVDTDGKIIAENCSQPNRFVITTEQTPATCDTPPQCNFGLDLEVFVPIPRIPCPDVRIGNFSVQSGYEYCLVEPENKFTITTKHIPPTSCQDPGSCAFELDLQLAVPIPDPPCPTILPGTINVKSGFGGDITYDDGNGNLIVADTCGGENSITITTEHTPSTCDTPAKCEFQVGLDIFVPVPRVPCPVIQTGNVSVISGYDLCVPEIENKLEVITRHVPPQTCDDPGSCAFDINLQIGVPIPTPTCPTITISKTTLNSGFTTFGVDTEDENVLTVCEGSYLNVTVVPIITPPECDKAPGCEFSLEFDANVFIPRTPCPVLNVTDIIVNSGYLYENRGEDCIATENKLVITPKHQEGKDCSDPGQCEFDIELEISVPIPKPPCPIIAVQKFEVVSGYPQCITDKQNVLKITTDHKEGVDCNDPGSCEFGLELELAIPIPEPNCPEIYVKSTQVRSGLISEQKTPDNKACQTASSLIITKTETKDCNGAPRCEFALEFDLGIFVPRVPCPNIVVDSFKVATAFAGCTELQSGNVFSIVPRHIPGASCDDPGFCEFGVTLEVAVPIPRPVCPAIYVKEFVVNTKIQSSTQPCITEPNEFTITPKIVPAECPTKQPTCEFETTLRLNVPIPEVPCPQINVNKFSVKSGFNTGDCETGENRFSIIAREIPGNCTTPKSCAFDLDLEIYVPLPKPRCPNIQVGQFNVSSGFTGEGCESGSNSFTIEKVVVAEGDCDTPEECDFFLNLDIAVPIPPPKCPSIGSQSTVTITVTDATEASGTGSLRVQSGAGCGGNTDTGSCEEAPACFYNIVLELELEIPKVCDPKLVVNSSTVDAGYDRPTFFIATATYTTRPECLLTLDMDLSINVPRPPCPDITAQVKLLTLPSTATPFANINVASAKVPGEYCNYQILLNLGIPQIPPCPQFLPGVVNASWSNDNVPTAEFAIEQAFFAINCVYIPTLKLQIPKPKCPYFDAGIVEVYWLGADDEPYLDFNIVYVNEVNGQCQYEYNLLLGIPKFNCPIFREGYVGVETLPWYSPPNVEFEILDNADRLDCAFQYGLRLELPGPQPCPVFNDNGVRATLVRGLEAPQIEFYIRPGPRDEFDPCQFDYYLKLDIPDQCPKWQAGHVGVELLPPNDPPRVEFEILDNADRVDCAFQYRLELFLPRPRPCPVFIKDDVFVVVRDDPNFIPEINFYIIPGAERLDGTCEFRYYLKLELAKPCVPTFSASGDGANGQVALIGPNEEPYIDFLITRIGETCHYEWYIKAGVPGPTKLVKGTTNASWTECGGDPEIDVTIGEPNADGEQTLDIELRIPRPPDYIGETWEVKDNAGNILGSATSSIDSEGCRRAVGGSIILNTAECPQDVAAFTARPTAAVQAPVEPLRKLPEPDILATVVKNLQLDRVTGKPVNPEFYGHMKAFFKQIQEDAHE